MANTGFFHHVGTFLLFAAFVLMLIASISSPVVNDISMLKVTLANQTGHHNSSVTFGSFGHCVLDVATTHNHTGTDSCSNRTIGYSITKTMATIDSTHFSNAASDTANSLTNVMILHPIGCFLAFVACCLALGAGFFGSLLASIVASVAWLVTIVVMATDFALFGIVKNHVNGDGSGSHAKFGVAMWCVLAAMVALFFGSFVVFFSCCSARRQRTRGEKFSAGKSYGSPPATRRRFWQRRTRY